MSDKSYPETPWTLDGAENIMGEVASVDVLDADGFVIAEIPVTCILAGWPEIEGVGHWADRPGETFIDREPKQVLALAQLFAAAPQLRAALDSLLNRYVGLVNCGDCGYWDPEEEDEVIQARAALALANEPADGGGE